MTSLKKPIPERYAPPPPPPGLREKYFPSQVIFTAQREKRKATTDILTPLYPVLRQVIRLCKQLKALGINDAIEVGEEFIATLKTIITALKTTQPTLLENANPKEVTLNALKQALIASEVELAQARAQGVTN
jgi:hypothetical protein